MTDIIVIAVILVIIGAAAGYIVGEKKKGVRCIGCPSAGSCPHNSGGCGCGCDDTDRG